MADRKQSASAVKAMRTVAILKLTGRNEEGQGMSRGSISEKPSMLYLLIAARRVATGIWKKPILWCCKLWMDG